MLAATQGIVPTNVCAPAVWYHDSTPKRSGMETGHQQLPVRKYVLYEQFYRVLAGVGAKKDKEYEWKEVIMLFIRYLARRKPSLLDPQDRSRVICEGDPLGDVFGVPHFTKDETKLLLRQQVWMVEDPRLLELPPPPPPETQAEAAKRAAGEASDVEDPDSKRSCLDGSPASGGSGSPAVGASVPPAGSGVLPASQPVVLATGADAAGAVAEEDADSADSGDELDEERRTYAREMEPVDGTEVSESDSSGCSDVESPLELTLLRSWGDDLGALADQDTSSSEGETQRDTWLCARPGCQHSNSAKRSKCERCWTTRPAWLVELRRKKRNRRRFSDLLPAHVTASSPPTSLDSQGSQGDASSSQASDLAVCLICCDKPRGACIIHGRTGCQVTCYGCARRLWKRRDRCPSCRRTIEKIVVLKFG